MAHFQNVSTTMGDFIAVNILSVMSKYGVNLRSDQSEYTSRNEPLYSEKLYVGFICKREKIISHTHMETYHTSQDQSLAYQNQTYIIFVQLFGLYPMRVFGISALDYTLISLDS